MANTVLEMVKDNNLGSLTGGDEGFAGFQSLLLPLVMMGSDIDLKSIIPLMLFSQTTGTGASAMSQMLPVMLALGSLSGGRNTTRSGPPSLTRI